MFLPKAHAGVVSFVNDIISSKNAEAASSSTDSNINSKNSQNADILQAETSTKGSTTPGVDVQTIGGALTVEVGPLGTMADIDNLYLPDSSEISLYAVHKGDTLSGIAKMFGVSVNTIAWANNLKPGQIPKVGDIYVILPISGIRYEIKKGDTITSIAKKLKVDASDIIFFNGLTPDENLKVGDIIIVPDAELNYSYTDKISSVTRTGKRREILRGIDVPNYDGYYVRPILSGKMTQGLHGFNGIDYGAPKGTPIVASAAGDVIIARSGGYGGGYGSYVVISHNNGTQTMYAHMSKVLVSAGDFVSQGQIIGLVGSTGRSTGNHLHYEVRGAKNNLAP